MNSTLNRILVEFTHGSIENPSLSPLQKELALKLSEGEKLQTLAEWKIRQNGELNTLETDRRLDRLLAEIETLAAENAQPFLTRAEVIAKETSLNRRSLLTDVNNHENDPFGGRLK